jgi:hypothetical protein
MASRPGSDRGKFGKAVPRADKHEVAPSDCAYSEDQDQIEEFYETDDHDEAHVNRAERQMFDLLDTRRSAQIAFQAVLGMMHGFATTVCIARSLAAGNRDIDLRGLHEAAGVLCARALDLRPEHGRKLIPRFRSLLEELDGLHTILAPATSKGGIDAD